MLNIEFPIWEPEVVRVIGRRAIRAFAERYPEALEPLLHWANATEAVDWKTEFDVSGYKYRVVAFVHYRRKVVYIKNVLTHPEYDKGAWKR